ncbi:VanZ family protein [Maricaulis sp.]|uniref:VanZ family protein n=1 Tax=Maricaulis sp. TaxID=1486257 RepID=UPI003A8FD474
MLFVTTLLLVTDLALQPGLPSPPEIFGPDKIEHILAFFVLTALARMGWPRRAWTIAVLMLAYGIGIEFAQAMTSVGRYASAADVVADAIGISAGLIFAHLLGRHAPR